MNFHVRKSTMRNESTLQKSEQKKKHKYYVSTQVFLNFDESFKNEVIVKNWHRLMKCWV